MNKILKNSILKLVINQKLINLNNLQKKIKKKKSFKTLINIKYKIKFLINDQMKKIINKRTLSIKTIKIQNLPNKINKIKKNLKFYIKKLKGG